ncbi:MAG: TOMM precursor leader peptide-binding protein [Nitrospira sp.]|nr:TOMM precursor leader peptide-binding protein [Nitrospira sp.]
MKSLPVQLLDLPGGVLVKRGCTEFKISGGEARIVLETILAAAAGDGASSEEICERFPLYARGIAEKLVEQLISRRILIDYDPPESMKNEIEDSIDIFYWQFGKQTQSTVNKLNTHRLAILGVTTIARQLVTALSALKLNSFEVIDYPLLRNLRLFDANGIIATDHWPSSLKAPLDYEKWLEDVQAFPVDCIIATSDFGYTPTLIEWNRFCVERNCHFMPVVLHHMIGYVGPLVIPGETACFDCLQMRQNAHMQAPLLQRASEQGAFEGQIVTGFHPSMVSILSDITAFELSRFYGGVIPNSQVGTLIEVNLLNTQMKTRKVLKVPRCHACSPLNKRPSVSPYTSPFIPSSCDGI